MSNSNAPVKKTANNTQRLLESLVNRFESSVRRIVREEIDMAMSMGSGVIRESAPRRREAPPRKPFADKLLEKYSPREDYYADDEYEGDDEYETTYERRPAQRPAPPRAESQRLVESVLKDPVKEGFLDTGDDGMQARPLRIKTQEQVNALASMLRVYEDDVL